jgi:drug/metabolite transporter (DMT)-like permease
VTRIEAPAGRPAVRDAGWSRHPSWWMAAGALCVSASAVLIGLSGASPGTASFYRCLLALPFLVPLAVRERRGRAALPRRRLPWAVLAGALFAGDMLLWTRAIEEIGAGLSTVLVNVQVVLVPLLALLVDRERLTRRYLLVLPVLVVGVVLTSGVVQAGSGGGGSPVLGAVHAVLAALCYSGFLFLLRRGGAEGQVVRSYLVVVIAAAVVSLVVGALWRGVQWAPGWTTLGWLLLVAVSGQVVGWLLVALCSPRLSSQVGAILLLLTPVGAVVLAAVVLGERPAPAQLAGCALILAGAYAVLAASPPRGSEGTT